MSRNRQKLAKNSANGGMFPGSLVIASSYDSSQKDSPRCKETINLRGRVENLLLLWQQ